MNLLMNYRPKRRENTVRVLHIVVNDVTGRLKSLIFVWTDETRRVEEECRQSDDSVEQHDPVL